MIYVYTREGNIWADIRVPDDAKTLKRLDTRTAKACRKIIAKPGPNVPDRVGALAERALSELQVPPPLGKRIKRSYRVLRGFE